MGVSELSDSSLVTIPGRPYITGVENPAKVFSYPENSFVNNMTRWDGAHYILISQHGYVGTSEKNRLAVFFPLYPASVGLLARLTQIDIPVAGVVLSNVYFLLALYVLYFFVRDRWKNEKVAASTLIFLGAFPTSFFYSAMYSESLFLLLSIFSFWMMERKRWLIAGVAVSLATATRVVGLALVPVLLLFIAEEFWKVRLSWRKNLKMVLTMAASLLVSPLGIFLYSRYLEQALGNSLLFIHAQSLWGTNTSFIGSLQDIFEVIMMGQSDPRFALMSGSLLGILFFILSFYYLCKHVDYKYVGYSLMLFFIPFQVRAESLLRYCGLIFPLFIALALARREQGFTQVYLYVCTGLLIAFYLIFINWGLFY